MNKKVTVVCLPVDIDKVSPKEAIGMLFKTETTGVWNIQNNLKDILKSQQWFGNTPQYMYIFSNDPIQEGDWTMSHNVGLYQNVYGVLGSVIGSKEYRKANNFKKILATTNPICQLPGIPKEFLQYYVKKQGDVGEVEVATQLTSDSHKIYGEFQRPDDDYPEKTWYELKLNSNNEVSIVYQNPEEEEDERFALYDAVKDYREAHPEVEEPIEAIEFAEWVQAKTIKVVDTNKSCYKSKNKQIDSYYTMKELYKIWKQSNSKNG